MGKEAQEDERGAERSKKNEIKNRGREAHQKHRLLLRVSAFGQ
jgi:hypothetical protein